MGAPLPKQFLPLGGVPVLGLTLRVFAALPAVGALVAVVPAGDLGYCREAVLEPLGLAGRVELVAGGAERQDSVWRGLEVLTGDDGLVLIHDGVRPLVTEAVIAAVLRGAARWGACIAALPVQDTVKCVDAEGRIRSTTVREGLWQAQTPQGFRLGIIRWAHQEARQAGFRGTDDAQLVERLGGEVRVVPGSPANIKITRPDDLALAAALQGAHPT